MSGPLAPRSALAVYIGVAIAVSMIVSLFVWPGFLTNDCATSLGPTESINGRTYCYVTVPIPRFFASYTEWNYKFNLHLLPLPDGPGLNVTVTEPSGTTYSGDLGIVGPLDNRTSAWTTPDNSSGVIALWSAWNVSLTVEK